MTKAKALASGVADGDGVLVADVAQANRLHNKALAGTPTSANGLRLSAVEAAYCVASGWLTVTRVGKDVDAVGLLAAAKDGRRALTDHLVYSDLRDRGFVARHAVRQATGAAGRFDVWPRGTAQGTPQFQALACSAADPVRAADLVQGATDGLVFAVVDEDSAVTHYRLAFEGPKGDVPPRRLPQVAGTVVADRVLVPDAGAAKACAAQFLGTPQGDGVLLSALEAAALQARGTLRLKGALPPPPAPEVLQAYTALRQAGVVVKSGFRFGAHLRGYVGAPDDAHAQWLLHCAAADAALPWSALSRGVRLAHGVRKHFLVAIPAGDDVRFVRIAWFRP